MISIHDIIAFIEYEKYFQSVERAEEKKARVAAPAPDSTYQVTTYWVIRAGRPNVIRAGRPNGVAPLSHA
jgi:hypothetical protein